MTTGPENTADPAADLEGAVKDLIVQGEKTADYIEGLRADIRRHTRVMRWTAVIGAVLLIVLAWVALDNHDRIEGLQRKMCPMVTILIPGPGDPQPPAGPAGDRGRDVIERATKLASAFGCR